MTAALIVALSLQAFNAAALIVGARIGVVTVKPPTRQRKPAAATEAKP